MTSTTSATTKPTEERQRLSSTKSIKEAQPVGIMAMDIDRRGGKSVSNSGGGSEQTTRTEEEESRQADDDSSSPSPSVRGRRITDHHKHGRSDDPNGTAVGVTIVTTDGAAASTADGSAMDSPHGTKRPRSSEYGGSIAPPSDTSNAPNTPSSSTTTSPMKLSPSVKDTPPGGRVRTRSAGRVDVSGSDNGNGNADAAAAGAISGPPSVPIPPKNIGGQKKSVESPTNSIIAPRGGGGGALGGTSSGGGSGVVDGVSPSGALCGGDAISSAISSMFLCCGSGDRSSARGDGAAAASSTSGTGAGVGSSGRGGNLRNLTASLPIPAVLSNGTMGSIGADLLLEEESTHGRRGVDQSSSFLDMTDVAAMGEDMALLEEARRGASRAALGSPKKMKNRKTNGGTTGTSSSRGGDLRRMGSSLAQSRADSMADMVAGGDETAEIATAPLSSSVLASVPAGDSIAEETKLDLSSVATWTPEDSPTVTSSDTRKLLVRKKSSNKLKGKIKSVFKKSSSRSLVRDGMDKSVNSVGSAPTTDWGSTVDLEDNNSTTEDAGEVQQPDAVPVLQPHLQSNGASTTASSSLVIPLIDTEASSHSLDVDDLGKQTSLQSPVEPPAPHVFGPPLGAFHDVSSADRSTANKELAGTYGSYRMDQFYVNHIIANMDTILPLFHHQKSLEGSKMWDSVSDLANMRGCCDRYDSAKAVREVCSEPSASSIKVRGGSYLKDSVKLGSAESMFSVLGVDNQFKSDSEDKMKHCCARKCSYLNRLRSVCKDAGIDAPFLLVLNFVLPWGNVMAYMYRPDGTDGGPFNEELEESVAAERLWRMFLEGDDAYRNRRLKFIPRLVEAPWLVKKMVGTAPALIAQKLPVSYYGSVEENYFEISLDVTAGPQIANTIATTVASKSDVVTVDLAFLIEGLVDEKELPEQLLTVYRLHHVNMKKTMSEAQWLDEIKQRQTLRQDDVDGVELL